jgi:hypothetical protein
MTDRELLELAAKAANVPLALLDLHDMDARKWNPLDDDGDALRLAVKVRIEVEPWIHGSDEFARAAVREVLVDEPHGSDPYAATRRAIVRAAAEIWKAMVGASND